MSVYVIPIEEDEQFRSKFDFMSDDKGYNVGVAWGIVRQHSKGRIIGI